MEKLGESFEYTVESGDSVKDWSWSFQNMCVHCSSIYNIGIYIYCVMYINICVCCCCIETYQNCYCGCLLYHTHGFQHLTKSSVIVAAASFDQSLVCYVSSGFCFQHIRPGVWAGVNYGPTLKYAWDTLDSVPPRATGTCEWERNVADSGFKVKQVMPNQCMNWYAVFWHQAHRSRNLLDPSCLDKNHLLAFKRCFARCAVVFIRPCYSS